MKERPVLFSAPMVRAILAGTKQQTRRVIKPRRDRYVGCEMAPNELAGEVNTGDYTNAPMVPGDRLWVRENGWERPARTPKMMREGADTWGPYYYDADGLTDSEAEDFKRWGFKRRPSIHMPRWASRITLEVTGVRCERLRDISAPDAHAEGVEGHYIEDGWYWRNYLLSGEDAAVSQMLESAQESFRSLWESINGPGSWDANPWVWVIGFKKADA